MKETNQSLNFPTWALILIIMLFVLGLVVALWGAISAFKIKGTNDNKNLSNVFKDKKNIKFGQTFESNKGIFALTFRNFNPKDYFIPIWIFKTEDLIKKMNEIKNKTDLNEMIIIFDYMKEHDLSIKDIYFVKLEDNDDESILNDWIELTQSNKRGFNK
ncbi:hypothetical protein [Spiroplasma diminutum]|nr:hypothetical protein [Spiroplasma diminutum]